MSGGVCRPRDFVDFIVFRVSTLTALWPSSRTLTWMIFSIVPGRLTAISCGTSYVSVLLTNSCRRTILAITAWLVGWLRRGRRKHIVRVKAPKDATQPRPLGPLLFVTADLDEFFRWARRFSRPLPRWWSRCRRIRQALLRQALL